MHVITKAALSSECWSGRSLNPRPPAQQTGALPTELTRRRFRWKNLCVKLWKWNERPTNSSVEGAAYCLKKKLCGKTLIKQDRFTQNQKKNTEDLWYQVKKHIFYVPSLSCVEHVVASLLKSRQKQIADFKGPSLLRKFRKDPKMKKKTISVTVTYLLISKTGSSESRSELSSMAELTIVQAECQRYMKSLFNTRLLCGESGRFTRRARNKRSNARQFFSRSSPFFGLFCLVFFNFFLCLFF